MTHGARRDGTRRFHAYAAAYVIVQGQRFTLALIFVWAADRLVDGWQRLRQRLRQMGVKTKLLLLDRQFSTVEIIHLMCNSFLPRGLTLEPTESASDRSLGWGDTRNPRTVAVPRR